MGQTTTIASRPQALEGDEGRTSCNFNINQLPNEGHLIWHIITTMGDGDLSFDIREDCGERYEVRFENIKDGTITPYTAYRNLYVANPKNVTGHFMVKVESCK